MSSIVATIPLKLLYTGGLITKYVMRSQVQWLPVLYVEPICTCYTNRFSLHVHVSLGSCR